MFKAICRRLARCFTRLSLSRGQQVGVSTSASLEARLVTIQFVDGAGFCWEWNLTPDLAREWAWSIIGCADRADAAADYSND